MPGLPRASVAHRRRSVVCGLALLGVGVAAVSGACSSSSPSADSSHPAGVSSSPRPPQRVPTGEHGRPRGGFPKRLDERDVASVSRAFAVASFDSDTRIDKSPFDTQRRAARWASGQLAEQLRAGGVAPGGAAWDRMAAHDGYTAVAARQDRDDGRPRDQLRRAQRGWVVSATPRGKAGWRGQTDTHVVFVTLTRSGEHQPWRVTASRVSEGGDG